MSRWALTGLVMVLGAAGCVGDDTGVDVGQPQGFGVAEIVTGLAGPTQITPAPGGRLLIAQLNGEENAGTGQVVVVEPDRGRQPEVLFDSLLKPTGVAVTGGDVWVMEENRLSRGPLDGGELEVVLDDLPYNGRSEGTLTVAPDGGVLFDTSGRLRSGRPVEGSGVLFRLDPAAVDGGLQPEPEVVATGLKHGYAATFDHDGTLWLTEVSDGTFDGERAPDELMRVEPGADFAWPACIGDRVPVADHGGTADACSAAAPSHAVFSPGATPTSVAVAPWDPDELLVALWNEGLVVSVSRAGEPPVTPVPFITGIEHPQHLLTDGDRLLVVDHGEGRVLAVTASSGN